MHIDAAAAGFSSDKLQRIGEHINQRYIEPKKIAGCQILIARKGINAYFESFGHMDLERQRPMQDLSLIHISEPTRPY